MNSRLVGVVVLTAFLNTLWGCTKVVTVPMSEVRETQAKKVLKVMDKSGKEVTFNEWGGKYDPTLKEISGITQEGLFWQKKIRSLKTAVVENSGDHAAGSHEVPANQLSKRYKDWSDIPVKEAKLLSGVIAKFDGKGGDIFYSFQTIRGFSKDGERLELRFDEVDTLKVRERDNVRTAITAVICVSAIVAAVIALMVHSIMDSDSGWIIVN